MGSKQVDLQTVRDRIGDILPGDGGTTSFAAVPGAVSIVLLQADPEAAAGTIMEQISPLLQFFMLMIAIVMFILFLAFAGLAFLGRASNTSKGPLSAGQSAVTAVILLIGCAVFGILPTVAADLGFAFAEYIDPIAIFG